MTSREMRVLHQIHPAKLGTDGAAGIAFLWLLWAHLPGLAFAAGFIPPIVASFVLMKRPASIEPLRHSAFGEYVLKHMTPAVEAWRLLTLLPMGFGAWFHEPLWIAVGMAALALAWSNGLITKRD